MIFHYRNYYYHYYYYYYYYYYYFTKTCKLFRMPLLRKLLQ